MSVELVTGTWNKSHVTSAQARELNASIIGMDDYVLSTLDQCKATVISANEIKISSGALSIQGAHVAIDAGGESLTIANGTGGFNRNDLIVCTYTRDGSTGVESAALEVLRGTPVAGEPQDPQYTQGSILSGDLYVQVPLYRIQIRELVVEEPELLLPVVKPLKAMNEAWDSISPVYRRINDYFVLLTSGKTAILRIADFPISQVANSEQWVATLPSDIVPLALVANTLGCSSGASGVTIMVGREETQRIIVKTRTAALSNIYVTGELVFFFN